MTKKVGFVGPYSTANLGDYAMLVNNIFDIGCNDFIVFSYSEIFPKISLDLYCKDFQIDYFEPLINGVGKASTFDKNNNLTPMEILSQVSNKKELEDKISKLDIIVVSGGGWLNHFWAEKMDKLIKIMAPLLVARQQNKKIVFTANGIGPFDKKNEFYRYFFRYINDADIAIRDQFLSPLYLSDMGISEYKTIHLPDDLFVLNKKLLSKERNFFPKSKRYIVMEMFYPLKLLEDKISEIREFSETIKNNYDLDIVFLPYDLIHYGLEQARFLHEHIANSEIIDIGSIGFLPIQDAYHIIKNSEFMLSSRYHGLVLALAAQTPVIYRPIPKSGDLRYSYSKAIGLLRTVFNGFLFDEHQFLELDLIGSLNRISNEYSDISKYQKELFKNELYKKNKRNLSDRRHRFLRSFIS